MPLRRDSNGKLGGMAGNRASGNLTPNTSSESAPMSS
jgi:hypothetical protein